MGKCIIWNFGTESTLSLGVSMPATASPRHRTRLSRRSLPSGTAELRRRIITFYADFNTRLRPIPFPSSSCRSYPVMGISNRRFIAAISFARSSAFKRRRILPALCHASFSFFFSYTNHQKYDFFGESNVVGCRSR